MATGVGAQEVGWEEVPSEEVPSEEVASPPPVKKPAVKKPRPTRRRGSFILRNEDPVPPPDFRGDLGRRRDHEVRVHFRRLAELDVLERLGRKHKEAGMSQRVEQARRQEQARHRVMMEFLRQAAEYTVGVGIP